LIALGVIFLLDSLEVFGEDTDVVGSIWPLFIIGVGFVMWARQRYSFVLAPVLVMAVGVLLFADSLSDSDVWRFWPVLLIIVGAWFVWRRAHVPGAAAGATEHTGTVNINSVFGGSEHRVTGEFQGGQVSAIMGGGALDLRGATLSPEGATVDVNVILGGFELRVPDSWNVTLSVDAFLGGVEDKRTAVAQHDTGAPVLTIRGSTFLGGLEVKS
jgi:predicted membrane protein